MDKYENETQEKAYRALTQIDRMRDSLTDLITVIDDLGWSQQALSRHIYRECGVYEMYMSNDRVEGYFISDRIGDAFYYSDTLPDFYDKLNEILLEKELDESYG